MKQFDKFSRKMRNIASSPRAKAILYNRYVLYAVLAIALGNLYAFAISKNISYIVIFALVGFLTSFFSKNMIVILVISLVITNLLKLGSSGRIEGFDEMTPENNAVKDEDEDEDEDEEDDGLEKPPKENMLSKLEPSGLDISGNPVGKKPDFVEQKKKQILNDGRELLELQGKITDGFKEIEPYMSKAEALTMQIGAAAKDIENNNKK